MTSQVITSPIPKDLASIPGISTGFQPVPVNQGRYIICGKPGCGKSTLINSNPKAFVIDPEKGGSTVDDPKALRFTADPDSTPEGETADAYRKMVDVLIARRKKGSKDFEMVVLDTYDELIEVFLRDFCLKHKLEDPLDYHSGEGNAYSIVRRDIWSILDRAHKAGFGWAILSHIRSKHIRLGKEDRTVQSFAVSDSFQGPMRRKSEHMMFMGRLKKTVKGEPTSRIIKGKTVAIPGEINQINTHVLKTKPGALWEGESSDEVKVRVPFPDSIEIPRLGGWEVVTKEYNEAIQTLTKGTTT